MTRTLWWFAALTIGVGCTDFEQATDFTPDSDALSIANFGAVAAPALLDSVAVQQLFGPTACEPSSSVGAACTLVPEAEYWSLHVNTSMSGGRCEGLSTFAQALFMGTDSLDTFGGGSAADLALDATVGSRIAFWQATQSLAGAVQNTDEFSGLETLRRLQEEFRLEGPLSRLGMVNLDEAGGPLGGHAVLPYGIVEGEESGWDILVYDPNEPSADTRVHVDADANSWTYDAGDGENGTYSGDITDDNGLWLTALAPRTNPGQCLLCEGSPAPGSTILMHGPASPVVSDCAELSLGYAADGFTDEGEFGAVRPSFSGLESDSAGLSFFVAESDDVCIDLISREPGADERDQLSVGLWRTDRRMAYVAGTAGVGIHSLASRSGGVELEYSTDVDSAGPLVLSGEADDNSRLVVRVETDAAPQTLRLQLVPADGDAIVDLGAAVDQALHLTLTRSRGLRRDVFVANLEAQPAGADLLLHTGSWSGDGRALSIEVDDDGDGTYDRTLTVDDCQDPAACLPPSGDDGDAVDEADDNCPNAFNPGQDDRDGDGVGDACDACADDPECVCAAGSWDDDSDLDTPCTPCAAGEYCSGGSEAPSSCGGATFDHDQDPATPCGSCDDGYTSSDGLTCE